MIGAVNEQLSKDNYMMGMASSVCDPIFLCQRSWSVDNELLCLLIIHCCCFHLHCIITIAKFCQTKTANIFQCVNSLEKLMERPASCKILYLCLMPEIANFWNTFFIGCSKHSIKTNDRPFEGLGMPKVHSLSPNNKRKQCHHTLYSLCSWRSLYIQVKHLSGCHIGFWQRRD